MHEKPEESSVLWYNGCKENRDKGQKTLHVRKLPCIAKETENR
jgi:hypothetical protein